LPSYPDHKYIWFRVGISIPQQGEAKPQVLVDERGRIVHPVDIDKLIL
jgi:hypothetical protein